jgi:lactoylglutathione lyase
MAAMSVELLVNVDVDDLERGVRFYCDGLGLRVGRRFGIAAVELMGAAAPIYLLLKAAGSAPFGRAAAARTYRRHWTPVHLDFVVPELEPALARVVGAGAVREGEISEHAWGRMVLLADPFGHGLCLLQMNERGYDAIATP